MDLWGLTNKEAEIMLLLSEGLDCKQISRKLNIAHATIRNHVYNVKKKMGPETHTTARACVKFYCALKGYE